MNKVELIDEISNSVDVSKKDISAALSALVEIIESTVASGNDVVLTGFGKFTARKRPARTGRNPRTGEAMSIPAKTVPAFSAGRTFKTVVNS